MILNFFEAISLCFVTSSLLGISRENSRLRIFCHIVGIILLIIGFLLPSFRGYGYEKGSGEPGGDQPRPAPPPFTGLAPIISVPFAAYEYLHPFQACFLKLQSYNICS